jgi:hypothetical protein
MTTFLLQSPSRFTDIFLSSTFQLFFSPHLLAITFQSSSDNHGRQNSPLLSSRRVQQSAIGDVLHLLDSFLPIWQIHTFVDAVAFHWSAFIRRR